MLHPSKSILTLLTLLFVLNIVATQKILDYTFVDKSIIPDLGSHDGDLAPLIYPSELTNTSRPHVSDNVFVLTGNPTAHLETKPFSFVRATLSEKGEYSIDLDIELSRGDFGRSEFCLFCLKIKEFIPSMWPLEICKHFDVAITGIGRNIRFMTKTSTTDCLYSSRFIPITPNMVGKDILLRFKYNSTHLSIHHGNKVLFSERFQVDHDVSNWGESQQLYIGAINSIENDQFRVKLFEYSMTIGPSETIQSTSVEEDVPLTKPKVHADSVQFTKPPNRLARQFVKKSNSAVKTTKKPQTISVKKESTKSSFYNDVKSISGTGSGSKSNDDTCKNQNNALCVCKKRIGFNSILKEYSHTTSCNNPPRDDNAGSCCNKGSCSCSSDDPPVENLCSKCHIPIYWSYQNKGQLFKVNSSAISIETFRTTAPIHHRYNFHSQNIIQFKPGNHWIVYESVIEIQTSCYNLRTFTVQIKLNDNIVGSIDLDYIGNQQWNYDNIPFPPNSVFSLTGRIMKRPLELQIMEKSLMSPVEMIMASDVSQIQSVAADLTLTTTNPYLYWKRVQVASVVSGSETVDEFYLVIKNRGSARITYQQESHLESRYGYSANMKDLYGLIEQNIEGGSKIVSFQSSGANNTFETENCPGTETIGPFRVYQCVKLTSIPNLNYYTGSKLLPVSTPSIEFCITSSSKETIQEELSRLKTVDLSTPACKPIQNEKKQDCDLIDRCGVCNGDGSSCSVITNSSPLSKTCIDNHIKCSISLPENHEFTSLYTVVVNTTELDAMDQLDVVWQCKGSKKPTLKWTYAHETHKDVSECGNGNLMKRIGATQISFTDLYECFTGNPVNSIKQSVGFDELININGKFLMKQSNKRSGFTQSTPCFINVHGHVNHESPNGRNGRAHEERSGSIFIAESTTNHIRPTTKVIDLFYKNDDIFITYETNYHATSRNEAMTDIGIFSQFGPHVSIDTIGGAYEKDHINKIWGNIWKIRSNNQYFKVNTDFRSVAQFDFKFGSHMPLRMEWIIKEHRVAKFQLDAPRLMIKKPKSQRLGLCYFKDHSMRHPSKHFVPNDRVFIKLQLLERALSATSQVACTSTSCPFENSLSLKVSRVNLCAAPMDYVPDKSKPLSCTDIRGQRFNMLEYSKSNTLRSGTMWAATLEPFTNCSSSMLFSYKPNSNVYEFIAGKRLYLEVFWNSFDLNPSVFGYTEFESFDNNERFFSHSQHGTQFYNGFGSIEHGCNSLFWYDYYASRCRDPASWCFSWLLHSTAWFFTTFETVFVFMIIGLFIIMVIAALKCIHIVDLYQIGNDKKNDPVEIEQKDPKSTDGKSPAISTVGSGLGTFLYNRGMNERKV